MASGDSLLEIQPLGVELPASAYAQIGTRNAHPTIDFSATLLESAIWTSIMPLHYSGGGITVDIDWVSSATSGNVQWFVAIERLNTDIDADSFAANQNAIDTCPGTAGIVKRTSVALTNAQIDGLLAGESFRLRIQRDGTAGNASDTASSDAQIVAIQIRET